MVVPESDGRGGGTRRLCGVFNRPGRGDRLRARSRTSSKATVRFPIWGTADDLATLMDVIPVSDGSFTAPPYPNPPVGTFFSLDWHKERRVVIEGGQLLGAAIVAASKTRPDQRVTSAHVVFVKSASFDEPLRLAVDTRRRGSTLSLFDVKVDQGDALRASALVMTDAGADDLIRHGSPMPDVPGPSDCPRLDMGVLGRDIRVVDGAYPLRDASSGPTRTLRVDKIRLGTTERGRSPSAPCSAHHALLHRGGLTPT